MHKITSLYLIVAYESSYVDIYVCICACILGRYCRNAHLSPSLMWIKRADENMSIYTLYTHNWRYKRVYTVCTYSNYVNTVSTVILTWHINSGMILWNTQPLYPKPCSPVHSALKFSVKTQTGFISTSWSQGAVQAVFTFSWTYLRSLARHLHSAAKQQTLHSNSLLHFTWMLWAWWHAAGCRLHSKVHSRG